MKRSTLLLSLLFTALLPLRPARSQATASFPELDELHGWLAQHQPNFATGDSGVNGAIIVIDTNAHYVKSIAFRLGASELASWQGAIARAIELQDDTVSTNLLAGCSDRALASPPVKRPTCVQDGARVQGFDHLQLLASRSVEVLKSEAAVKRFGPNAANGAVVATTEAVTFERFKSLGATSANFVSFEGRRIRRDSDGRPVVITVLMLRGTSKEPP
jgi:hypothetical protein